MMKQNSAINNKIDILLEELLSEIPVVLDFIQADQNQREYGCCYYPFWKKVKDPLIPKSDFVNARWQELAYVLAFLYKTAFPGNRYYQDSRLGHLIKPVLLYWVRIQNRDGSFSEWLKDGHEYPPTAFGLQSMVETYKLCLEIFQENENKVIENAFHAAASWLMCHTDLMAVNHECSAVAALATVFSIYKLPEYKRTIDKKLNRILKCQDEEGWFREIDGPDTGYNTVSITQLALAYQYYRSEKLKEILEKALVFNSYFIYPDYMMGGGMNSRMAMNLSPLGFAMLGQEIDLARVMAFTCLDGFVNGKIRGTYNSSDYQRCSMLGQMFLFVHWLYKISKNYGMEFQNRKKLPAQCSENINYRLKNMGAAIVKTPVFYLASGYGASLGVVYSYKAQETLIYSSPYKLINTSGIYIDNGKSIYYSSNRGNSIETKWGDNYQVCRGRLLPVGKTGPDRWRHPGEGGVVKKMIRRRLPCIYGLLRKSRQIKDKWKRVLDLMLRGVTFCRELVWEERRILVRNEIRYKAGPDIIVRESVCIPDYGNKDYKVIFDGQDAISIDRNLNIRRDNVSKLVIAMESDPVLSFVFPEPLAIRVFCPMEYDEIDSPLSDMNAWGLAIEMAAQNSELPRRLDYCVYFS